MVQHRWGDKDVDWKGISDCVSYFYTYSRKWGRLGGQVKEKYGTIRFYSNFGHISLHTLVHPGYVYNQFPNWLWQLDCRYIGPILQFFFEKLFVKWQVFIYNRMYQNALKKWPHLRAEILCAADYLELIKGVTKREDKKLHILGWNGEILSTWESL